MTAFFTVIGSIAYTIRKLINNVGDHMLICDQTVFLTTLKCLILVTLSFVEVSLSSSSIIWDWYDLEVAGEKLLIGLFDNL